MKIEVLWDVNVMCVTAIYFSVISQKTQIFSNATVRNSKHEPYSILNEYYAHKF